MMVRFTFVPCLLLLISGVQAFVPHQQPIKRLVKPLELSTERLVPDSSDDENPRTSKLPPGRRTPRFVNFLFDDSLRLLNPKTMKSYQLARKEQYGDVFKTNIFGKPTVFCTSEEALAELGQQEARGGMEAFFPPHHQTLFGPQALLVQSGPTHSRLRKLIQPVLSPSVTKSLYQPIVEDGLTQFLEEIKAESSGGEYIELVPKLRSFFISIALQILLGPGTQVPQGLAEDLTIWSKGLLSAPLTFIPWSTAAKALRARKRICAVVEPLLEQERKSDHCTNSLLGRFVSSEDEEGNRLSNEDILDNALTLIFAGSDTTASAATSLFLALAVKPELKAQLKEAASSSDGAAVDAMVHQILQAYPPAPFSMRLTKKPLSLQGYDIPEGWLAIYGFAGALGESEVVANLLSEMDPANGSVAFGAGPRMCPGRYLAVTELSILCNKLLDCDWELNPSQDLTQTYNPGFFPKDGLQIRFK